MRKRKGSHGKQSRATRAKIKAGVRLYWKRVKRLSRKSKTTLKKSRRLYKAGLGRPKSDKRKKAAPRIRATGILWEGKQFVMSFEENIRPKLAKKIPKKPRKYVGRMIYKRHDFEADYVEDISWAANSEDSFWAEYWIAMKDWLAFILAQFEPKTLLKSKGPSDVTPPATGSAEIHKVTMGKPDGVSL